jgi:hypothetical protein
MVAQPNEGIKRYNTMTTDNTTQADLKAQLLTMASNDDKFARSLHGGLWPASAEPSIDALITRLTEQRANHITASMLLSTAEMFTTANTVSAAAQTEAVRIGLDLPSAS